MLSSARPLCPDEDHEAQQADRFALEWSQAGLPPLEPCFSPNPILPLALSSWKKGLDFIVEEEKIL